MNLNRILTLDDNQLNRIEELSKQYKMMYEEPQHCSPMFIINGPSQNLPTWEERLKDPIKMLQAQLERLRFHIQAEDDRIPTLRVEFGTGQVAAAFGCEIAIPTNSLPAVKSHVIKNIKDVYEMEKPSLDAGMYGKLKEFTTVFLENMPYGVQVQPPDLQSPFNCAHLIRGNDIFLDFFDDPEALEYLLDLVTDYMIDLVPYLKHMVRSSNEWFLDYGALWKGGARISNCTMHLISPAMYAEFVLQRDMRLFKEIGGGRIHYCGSYKEVIDEFVKIPNLTGLDFNSGLPANELWNLGEQVICFVHYGIKLAT
jgi:uroporphyrinogen-III decarboxylase